MKREFFHSLLVPLLVIFAGSCFHRVINKNENCLNPELANSIESLHKTELKKLKNRLLNDNPEKYGGHACKNALLAKIFFADGDMTLASNYFHMASQEFPDIASYFLLARAKSEQKKREFGLAKSIISSISQTPLAMNSKGFLLRTKRVLAEIAIEEKDRTQIIQTHKALLANGYKADQAVLFNLAFALDQGGDIKEANEIYKRLLIKFPTSIEANEVSKLKKLSDLGFSVEEREKRFNAMIKNLAFDQAIKDTHEHPFPDGSIFRSKALIMSNRFHEGIGEARKLSKTRSVKSLENLAWGLAKTDNYLEASKVYYELAKKADDSLLKTKACFFSGFSLYEASFYSMARLTWQKCIPDKINKEFEEDLLWYQALSALIDSDYIHSKNTLLQLVNQFPKSLYNDKYRYFLAYTNRWLGLNQEADEILKDSLKLNPTSYYALLARKNLKILEPDGQNIPHDAFFNTERFEDDNFKRGLKLYSLGFLEEAKEEIHKAKISEKAKLAVLQKMQNFDLVLRRAHLIPQEFSINDGKINTKPQIRASYPLPYRMVVKEMCRKYRLKESFLYAMMKTESGFELKASSHRGAIGLMQMMPNVADDLAQQIAIPEFSREGLKDPKISIALGAVMIAALTYQFGHPHLVLAAYNAGPHQVQKWLDRFGYLPTEIFIERIPFKETREYVKRVLRDESIYNALEGKPYSILL